MPPRALRVLLAEDNTISREFALAVLRGAGHSVTSVADCRAAADRALAARLASDLGKTMVDTDRALRCWLDLQAMAVAG